MTALDWMQCDLKWASIPTTATKARNDFSHPVPGFDSHLHSTSPNHLPPPPPLDLVFWLEMTEGSETLKEEETVENKVKKVPEHFSQRGRVKNTIPTLNKGGKET
ncbi:hypothetical protein TNCT_420761 [Trichonephila clavata]|uniref:Uncharacterized protein n=1 Tax=Trichonephila clavata TaxID=2740835 RepID=A0A8X6L886_TRICU|nr:hypothetical protein TNCT_420761 [Trichonephila clavata]